MNTKGRGCMKRGPVVFCITLFSKEPDFAFIHWEGQIITYQESLLTT